MLPSCQQFQSINQSVIPKRPNKSKDLSDSFEETAETTVKFSITWGDSQVPKFITLKVILILSKIRKLSPKM